MGGASVARKERMKYMCASVRCSESARTDMSTLEWQENREHPPSRRIKKTTTHLLHSQKATTLFSHANLKNSQPSARNDNSLSCGPRLLSDEYHVEDKQNSTRSRERRTNAK
jgi:hypothetical protein